MSANAQQPPSVLRQDLLRLHHAHDIHAACAVNSNNQQPGTSIELRGGIETVTHETNFEAANYERNGVSNVAGRLRIRT